MYVNCQGALAIKIWPGIFILKNCEVHQNQKNGTKQPNGYILSAYRVADNTDFTAWYFGHFHEDTEVADMFYCLYDDIVVL